MTKKKKENNSTAEVKYFRAKDVAKRLSMSIATVWRLSKDGALPKPLKITPSITAWRVKDIENWEAALNE